MIDLSVHKRKSFDRRNDLYRFSRAQRAQNVRIAHAFEALPTMSKISLRSIASPTRSGSRFFPCFNNLFTSFAIFRNILCLSQKDGGQKPAFCARDVESRKRENRLSADESNCCRVFVIVQNLFHIVRACGILRKRLCNVQDRKIVPHVIFAVNRIFDSVFDVNGIRPNGETAVVFRRRRSDDACRIRNRRVGKGEIAEVFA